MEAEQIKVIYVYEKIPAKVIVKYVDEEGTEISEDTKLDGYVKDNYKTEAKEIDGYELKTEPTNKSGIMKQELITVTYIYQKAQVPESPKKDEDSNKSKIVEKTKEETTKNTTSSEKKNTSSIYTGDEANKVKYVVIIVVAGTYLACTGIGVFVLIRRKKNK